MISQIDINAFKEDQGMATRELTPEDKARVRANLTTEKVHNFQKEQLEVRFRELGILRVDVAKSKEDYDTKPTEETKL